MVLVDLLRECKGFRLHFVSGSSARDEFDPIMLFNKLEGGSKVIVKDSNKDLPSNWWKLDLGQQDIGIAFDVRTKMYNGT